jgi:hypothetical protein
MKFLPLLLCALLPSCMSISSFGFKESASPPPRYEQWETADGRFVTVDHVNNTVCIYAPAPKQ